MGLRNSRTTDENQRKFRSSLHEPKNESLLNQLLNSDTFL